MEERREREEEKREEREEEKREESGTESTIKPKECKRKV